jgi:hypothetical protein
MVSSKAKMVSISLRAELTAVDETAAYLLLEILEDAMPVIAPEHQRRKFMAEKEKHKHFSQGRE